VLLPVPRWDVNDEVQGRLVANAGRDAIKLSNKSLVEALECRAIYGVFEPMSIETGVHFQQFQSLLSFITGKLLHTPIQHLLPHVKIYSNADSLPHIKIYSKQICSYIDNPRDQA